MLPIYRLTLDDLDEETGMFLISLVDKPAMQVQAVKLNEAAQLVTLKATDEMKQYLTSAVIIPNKNIYRNDSAGEYYVNFSADDVEKIRDKFFQKTGNLSLSNKNHVSDDTVDAQLIESWIIENPTMDKAVALGFEGLPKGTLMATYKVKDKSFWDNEVMTGNVTGFSLEGNFKPVQVNMSAAPKSAFQELMDYIDELANERK
jgi:Putative phage serine protease XkdF